MKKILTKQKLLILSGSKFIENFKEVKYLRIVKSLNELLEKLLIFDYDLNDKVIENVKYNLDNRVENYPDIYFNKIEKDHLIFTCLNLENKEVKPINIAVNIKDYNNMIDYIGGLDKIAETKEFQYVNLRRNNK